MRIVRALAIMLAASTLGAQQQAAGGKTIQAIAPGPVTVTATTVTTTGKIITTAVSFVVRLREIASIKMYISLNPLVEFTAETAPRVGPIQSCIYLVARDSSGVPITGARIAVSTNDTAYIRLAALLSCPDTTVAPATSPLSREETAMANKKKAETSTPVTPLDVLAATLKEVAEARGNDTQLLSLAKHINAHAHGAETIEELEEATEEA